MIFFHKKIFFFEKKKSEKKKKKVFRELWREVKVPDETQLKKELEKSTFVYSLFLKKKQNSNNY